MFTFRELVRITDGEVVNFVGDREITHFVTDSRRSLAVPSAVFVAIGGERHDGHRFIEEVIRQGIDQVIVEKDVVVQGAMKRANILKVRGSVAALQKIAAVHRQRFDIPVITITGSNGKTIVKEWLAEILSRHYRLARSPKSYNSQLGVPLSVLQLQEYHDLALFEAGISRRGEMQKLEKVIAPTMGIFTNIGPAHDEGFESREEKCREKWALFRNAGSVVHCADHAMIAQSKPGDGPSTVTWGEGSGAEVPVTRIPGVEYTVEVRYRGRPYSFHMPFTDPASVENLVHCIVTGLHLGVPYEKIYDAVKSLRKVSMRMELREGINGCRIVDDSYTNDIAGLDSALDFLLQQPASRHTAILSDALQTGMPETKLFDTLKQLIGGKRIDRVIGIGPAWLRSGRHILPRVEVYPDTDTFLHEFDVQSLRDEAVLVKGARIFAFERIVDALVLKVHGTSLEINLDALSRNLNHFRKMLRPAVKTMAMVKAFAYGSGSFEVANLMQLQRVDYLGVAFVDEGINLRKHGISLPIMVMNTTPGSVTRMFEFDLEPEIYSPRLLHEIAAFARETEQTVPVHVKFDTGMHRLGFDETNIGELIDVVQGHDNIQVKSVFTHLAASDDPKQDRFTRDQVALFEQLTDRFVAETKSRPLLHVLNSAGISRYPEFQFDMVRLGIGLYGYDPARVDEAGIDHISTLKTVISQVRNLEPGDTVGYGRRGKINRPSRIATIAIGYADGYSRAFGNGIGKVLVRDVLAPVIGSVCMDMTMIDVTGIAAEEGDEVIVFGRKPRIDELAHSIGTIPYEILTSISNRVKRVYFTG